MIRRILMVAGITVFCAQAQASEVRSLRLVAGTGLQIHAPMPAEGGTLVITAESWGDPVEVEIEHSYGADCAIVSERVVSRPEAVEIAVSFKPNGEATDYASCEILVKNAGRLNLIEAGARLN